MVAVDKSESATTATPFAIARRGYDQRQVDERITRLSTELKEAAQARDSAMATAAELSKALNYTQQELADAKAGLVRMTASPSGASAMAERVRMMMQLAEEEIGDLRAKAEEDAAATRAEADKDAHTARRAAEKQAKDVQAEQEQKFEEQRAKNELMLTEAREAQQQRDTEAQERREAAEKAAAEELAEKKATAERAAAEEQSAVKERVEAIASAAELRQAEAEQRRVDAEAQAKQALDFRRKVTEQITATDSALREALKHLAPVSGGQEEDTEAAAKPAAVKPAPAPSAAKDKVQAK